MIITTLNHSSRIEPLHPLFKKLFDYVKTHDLLQAPLGKIELDGDDLFINNVHPECKKKEEQVLEMHRDYIDVHIVLEGAETIGWKDIDAIQHLSQDYQKEGDFALSDDQPSTFVTLYPGQCCIVYPEDPHAPLIGSGRIRKLVGKVKL